MTRSIDAVIGRRMRQRRSVLGMTAQELGDRIGITSGQVEKYETGAEQISSRRIWDIAKAMEVPVMFFFEGLDGQPTGTGMPGGELFTVQEMVDLSRA